MNSSYDESEADDNRFRVSASEGFLIYVPENVTDRYDKEYLGSVEPAKMWFAHTFAMFLAAQNGTYGIDYLEIGERKIDFSKRGLDQLILQEANGGWDQENILQIRIEYNTAPYVKFELEKSLKNHDQTQVVDLCFVGNYLPITSNGELSMQEEFSARKECLEKLENLVTDFNTFLEQYEMHDKISFTKYNVQVNYPF